MLNIGLLSDTHGHVPEGMADFFRDVDEVWHAGDIGSEDVAKAIAGRWPLVAVHGNIDDWRLRRDYPEFVALEREGLRILMTHIGGYPGNYSPGGLRLIREHHPGLFISGHSHILKVMPDPVHHLLHINPGAAGIHGFHHKVTMVRFRIENGRLKDLEVYEADR